MHPNNVMEEHWYDLITAVLTAICVIGSSANLAVIIIVAKNRKVCQSAWILRLPETRRIILVLWIYSFIVSSPPLFGWGDFVLEGPGISCPVNWMSTTWNSLSYITFLFTIGFFLQILIMSISYMSIHSAIRQVASTAERQTVTVAGRAERRVACMLTLMVICFLVAWLPYALFALTKVCHAVLGSSAMLIDVDGIYGYIPALLAKSSIIYNPVIYVFFNTQIYHNGRNFSVNQVTGAECNRTDRQTRVTINHIDDIDIPRISCVGESQLASVQINAVSPEVSSKTSQIKSNH